MEITVTKTVEEKIKIELPAYYKTNAHNFKIINDKKCINVCHLNGHEQIAMQHADAPFNCGATESNEEEFLSAFNAIKLLIEQLTFKQ